MASQFSLVGKSIKEIRHNPIIFVPHILYYVASIPLSLLVYLALIPAVAIYLTTKSIIATSVAGAIALILYFALFLIVFSLYLASAGGVACDVVIKSKTSFERGFYHSKKFFKPLLKTLLASLVIMLLPLLVFAAISGAAFLISKNAGIAASIFFIFAYTIFALALSILSVFTFPIVFANNVSGFKAILEAIRYGKSHPAHIFSVIGINVLLLLIFYMLLLVVATPVAGLGALQASGSSVALTVSYLFASLIYYAAIMAASLFFTILLFMYLFNSYIDKNPVKNWK